MYRNGQGVSLSLMKGTWHKTTTENGVASQNRNPRAGCFPVRVPVLVQRYPPPKIGNSNKSYIIYTCLFLSRSVYVHLLLWNKIHEGHIKYTHRVHVVLWACRVHSLHCVPGTVAHISHVQHVFFPFRFHENIFSH